MSLISDDTLTDPEILQEQYGKTDMGKVCKCFDQTGVFYGVHTTDTGFSLYLQTNLGPHANEVCEMTFDRKGSFNHVKGM